MSSEENNNPYNIYEKTILRLMGAYLKSYPDREDLMKKIACFLGVNFNLDVIMQYSSEEYFENDL